MRIVLCLVVFALVVRVGVLVADRSDHRLLDGLTVSQLSSAESDPGLDPDSYGRLALNLDRSGVYGFGSEAEGLADPTSVQATAFRPPLYPWLLSWLVANDELSGIANAVLHVGFGLLSILLVYRIALLLGLGDAAWIPAMAVTLDPLLLRASQLRMTETLATTLMLFLWWSWIEWWEWAQRSRGAMRGRVLAVLLGIGFVAGLAVLARPTFAPWCFFVCMGLWFRSGYATEASNPASSANSPRPVFYSLLFAAGLLVVVVPWMVRNYKQLGRPIWATTHGGYTLLLANNPSLYEHFANNGPSRDWDAEPFHVAWSHRGDDDAQPWEESYWSMDFPPTTSPHPAELPDNALAYRAAWATMSREPLSCLRASVYRLGWFWALWPHESGGLQRWTIAAWYAAFFAMALLGLWKLGFHHRRRFETGFSNWFPGLVFVLTLTIVHAVFWSNMRMRAPLMPVVYLLSTVPLSSIRRSHAMDRMSRVNKA